MESRVVGLHHLRSVETELRWLVKSSIDRLSCTVPDILRRERLVAAIMLHSKTIPAVCDLSDRTSARIAVRRIDACN